MLSLLFQIYRIRRKLGRLSDSDLLALPRVPDGSYTSAALDILPALNMSSMLVNDERLIMQSSLRMLDLSLDNGGRVQHRSELQILQLSKSESFETIARLNGTPNWLETWSLRSTFLQ